jgi:hypothetical protein
MPPLSDPQERRCLYGHINLIQEHPLWSGCFLYIEIVLQIVCVFKYFLQFTVFCNKNNNYERYLFKETLTDFNTSNKILISRGEQVMRRSASSCFSACVFCAGSSYNNSSVWTDSVDAISTRTCRESLVFPVSI